MIGRRKDGRGFSLLEAVISMAILGAIATGLLASFTYSRRAMIERTEKMIVSHLLETRMILFRNQGAAHVPVTVQPEVVQVSELRNGLIEWTVEKEEADNEFWKKIKITAGWDSASKPTAAHARASECDFSRTVMMFLSQG